MKLTGRWAGSSAEDCRDARGPPRDRRGQEQVLRGGGGGATRMRMLAAAAVESIHAAAIAAPAEHALEAVVAEGPSSKTPPSCQGQNSMETMVQ